MVPQMSGSPEEMVSETFDELLTVRKGMMMVMCLVILEHEGFKFFPKKTRSRAGNEPYERLGLCADSFSERVADGSAVQVL